jgi:glycine cleavage system H protein
MIIKNAIIGITDYAQRELGDIIYCDLEEVDTKLNIGDICSTIESVKESTDIQTFLSGDNLEVNDYL